MHVNVDLKAEHHTGNGIDVRHNLNHRRHVHSLAERQESAAEQDAEILRGGYGYHSTCGMTVRLSRSPSPPVSWGVTLVMELVWPIIDRGL